MDEYVGIDPTHPQSYHSFMYEHRKWKEKDPYKRKINLIIVLLFSVFNHGMSSPHVTIVEVSLTDFNTSLLILFSRYTSFPDQYPQRESLRLGARVQEV
jgi:hypothetical protein